VSSDVLGYSMPSSATKLTSEQMRENAIFASGARAILEDVFSTYLGGVP
jgi:hypothetical protein